MLQTFEVIVELDGVIHPLEELHIEAPTRAILTLQETSTPAEAKPARGSGAALLQFLQAHRLPAESRRSAEEIDTQIREEREAWD